MHKSLHSSKSYCECSTHQSRKPKTEENAPTRKFVTTHNITARGTSAAGANGKEWKEKGRAEWLRMTWSILAPEARKNQGPFLSRNSVAVVPAFAYCTNRCTRRKVTVNAHATNRENRKLKKTRRHEKFETTRNITARGTSSSGAKGREWEEKGRAEWLRMTWSILTPEPSKNQSGFFRQKSNNFENDNEKLLFLKQNHEMWNSF